MTRPPEEQEKAGPMPHEDRKVVVVLVEPDAHTRLKMSVALDDWYVAGMPSRQKFNLPASAMYPVYKAALAASPQSEYLPVPRFKLKALVEFAEEALAGGFDTKDAETNTFNDYVRDCRALLSKDPGEHHER